MVLTDKSGNFIYPGPDQLLAARIIDKFNSTDRSLTTFTVKLDDHINHGPRIIDRFLASKAKPGLHAHEGDLFECTVRRVGMYGADRTGMASVDCAQESYCLAATQFADDKPVRPHPQRGAHKIINGDIGFTLIASHSNQTKRIVASQPDFRRIFDGDEPLVPRNFLQQCIQQSGLARRRPT